MHQDLLHFDTFDAGLSFVRAEYMRHVIPRYLLHCLIPLKHECPTNRVVSQALCTLMLR